MTKKSVYLETPLFNIAPAFTAFCMAVLRDIVLNSPVKTIFFLKNGCISLKVSVAAAISETEILSKRLYLFRSPKDIWGFKSLNSFASILEYTFKKFSNDLFLH